ncbi:MAG: glucose-1-phosphate adenylyltransferase [Candidatus Omnitrophica bacterium]|nr:glucose-1-phosphate adenylyltransferase [Candidatus Omnitrophota bacterium]
MSAPQTTVLILGGGQGKRLYPLTRYRSKPAVPMGGKYRLVDIPISNCINSDLRKIFVLTQFNSTSLHRHIHRAFPYEAFNETSVELLAAEQTLANTDWFQGTADAVRKHFNHYRLQPEDTVLILSGDHLYRMDYQKILQYHIEKDADVTISTIPVEKKEISHYGIVQVQTDGRIISFLEKPSPSENIRPYIIPKKIRGAFHGEVFKEKYLASMGIYVFKASVLKEVLSGSEADFGREIIPKAIQKNKVYGHVFEGYWRDIGTIRSFYEANIELTRVKPKFSFLDWESRIFTRPRFLPPSYFGSSNLNQVQISEGVLCEAERIESSIIGLRSVIREGTVVLKSVIMGNDFYEFQTPKGHLPLGIGKNCRIENCILDKNVRIGNRVRITNAKKIKETNHETYCIRDGIVIIPKETTIPEGTVI